MEEFLKFLLVAAVLVVAFIRQTRKEAQKKQHAPQPPVMPQPEPVSPPEPEAHGDQTYGGYIPEGPAPEPTTPPRPKTRQSPARSFAKTKPKQNIPVSSPPAATPVTEDGTSDDYQIHSAEEARRAIIWSEILTRKY